ncbi:hypothetical protein, partial [Salmonella enterica]|uniref:hypothetical protein n=1 Tax=Salmonella enterica TaxID=28901 RepID=UPI003CE9F5B4
MSIKRSHDRAIKPAFLKMVTGCSKTLGEASFCAGVVIDGAELLEHFPGELKAALWSFQLGSYKPLAKLVFLG